MAYEATNVDPKSDEKKQEKSSNGSATKMQRLQPERRDINSKLRRL